MTVEFDTTPFEAIKVRTAADHPGEVLGYFQKTLPMEIYTEKFFVEITVLKAGGIGDVACYTALVAAEKWSDPGPNIILPDVARFGCKLTERQARVIFPDLDARGFYRP